jgi:hypothetical protein
MARHQWRTKVRRYEGPARCRSAFRADCGIYRRGESNGYIIM